MKPLLLSFFVLLFAGCAGSQQIDTYVAPRLIEQEPFPALPPNLAAYSQDFHIKLQIGSDGSVLRVTLEHWSGDADWDSLAVSKIRLWRFTPPMYNGKPIKLWIDLQACVRCAEPVLRGLAEIVCPTRELADSVYALLRQGGEFEQIASLYSIAPSRANRGRLGEVDIHRFPDELHDALSDLQLNEYTSPLAVGSYFCIYKRVPWDVRVP
jgi:hypothetical protein